MRRLPRFSDLRFASKMLLLMGLFGLVALVITVYALTSMRAVNQQYGYLIAHEGRGALTIGEAARHLDSASRLAYTVLTEPDEARMLASKEELRAIKIRYDSELRNLEEVLPNKTAQVQRITSESAELFEAAERIITAASRWRGDRALQIIHREFEPMLHGLRSDMGSLRDGAIAQFKSSSTELSRRTEQTTLFTMLAVLAAFFLVIPLSVYVGIMQISRPLAHLTSTMERMSQRHYDDAIELTERRDEVGQMAKALQVFQRSMQREDRLAVEVAASAEARRLSEQLVDLISAIPGAVFQMHVTQNGVRRILFASERAAQLHGRTIAQLEQAEALAGHEFLHAHDQEIQIAHTAFLRSVHSLEPLNFDTQIAPNGQTRWIKTLATARRTVGGGALFNGVWLDVTEQKEQAQALTQAKNLAEKAADDKARFLATMSHEIRTPLNAMLGMTQLAIRHETEAPQRERLDKALRAGRHLLNIVNDVLDISKIEAGKMVIEPEDFSPREWLAELRELLFAHAQAQGLDLQLYIAPAAPDLIRGDRQRMGQILINYVNNAIKFTQAGAITIFLDAPDITEKGMLLRCRVQDTGIGVAESDQAKLFSAFAQADASITRRFGGTGLGLAISRQLSHMMGGEAGMTSVVGKGSTFWFTARVTVPAMRTPTTAPASAIAQTPAMAVGSRSALRLPYRDTPFGRGAHVLVVDDNELNRAVAHGMLQVGGVTVDEACDGAQALAMLEAAADGTYALVLMDMQMPVLDGITASRALRANARFTQLPIIALTANASEDDIARTRDAGMNDHLSKPLLEETLWRCLHHWLPLQPSAPRQAAAQVDASVLEELRGGLGAVQTNALLAAYVRDCERRFSRMRAIAEKPGPLEWSALAKEAHDVSGSAGSFGLTRLGDMAHQLRALIDQRDETRARLAIDQLLASAEVDLAGLRVRSDGPMLKNLLSANS